MEQEAHLDFSSHGSQADGEAERVVAGVDRPRLPS